MVSVVGLSCTALFHFVVHSVWHSWWFDPRGMRPPCGLQATHVSTEEDSAAYYSEHRSKSDKHGVDGDSSRRVVS